MRALKWAIALVTCAVVAGLSWYLTRPGTEIVAASGPTHAGTVTSGPSERMPEKLVGGWQGNAAGPGGAQQVALTLRDGKVGETVGESSVPGTDCVFDLKLDAVDRDSIQVTEMKKSGGNCIPSSGRVALAGTALRYSTRTSDGDVVSGTLERQ
jgi:hypothetical protein